MQTYWGQCGWSTFAFKQYYYAAIETKCENWEPKIGRDVFQSCSHSQLMMGVIYTCVPPLPYMYYVLYNETSYGRTLYTRQGHSKKDLYIRDTALGSQKLLTCSFSTLKISKKQTTSLYTKDKQVNLYCVPCSEVPLYVCTMSCLYHKNFNYLS